MESASLSDALINLIPIYGPWIIFGIVGNVVVFFRRFIAVLRMFGALLADANCMPAGRSFFFSMTGRVCWACLFVFGYVYRKLKLGRSGGEVRQGWRVI
jgi:membrane protein DedA with SNARE-associated domain